MTIWLLALILLSVGITVDGVQVTPIWSAWVALVGGLLILLLRRESPRWGPGIWPLVGLALGRLISAAAHNSGWDMALAACAGPVAYLVWHNRPDRTDNALRVASLLLLLLASVQLSGSLYLLNRNVLAHFMLLTIPAWLMLAEDRELIPASLAMAAALALLIAGTGSKGATLGALVLGLTWLGAAWIAVPVAPAAGILLVQYSRWNSIQWRLTNWRKALAIWLRHPLLGAGPRTPTWPEHPAGVHGHNLLMTTLAWDGVLGALLLAGGFWLLIRRLPRWPRWVAAGLIGVGVHYLVDDFSWSAASLAMLAALLAASPLSTAQAGASSSHI